ncbi:site-specific integrase [Proteiniphilum sp.]|uniref:tyrosine-type recombinase/integrase n=1 Tax=Proteiniphilum sp. TaxID=1926877 RepID=UPI002B21647A|nr:site-specific integrase [Proteiniphilum sp.]MEA4918123.1 site-specific integrase [Proteiniphilum sp.]
MKIKDIVKLWMAEKKLQVKASSLSTYMNHVDNYIIPEFGGLEEITEEIIQEWIYRAINDGKISGKSVRDVIITLKMILKYGAKKKLINFPDFELNYPTHSLSAKTKLEVLSKADYKKLTDYLFGNFTFQNLGLLITLYTGMRIGEVSALKWYDVDLVEGVFHVDATIQRIYFFDEEEGKKRTKVIMDSAKTINSTRDIPISKKLLPILKSVKKVVNDDFFVLSNGPKPIEPRTYRNYYKKVLDKLNIRRIKFHGLRHTFATYLIEGGADVKTTSVLLGHSKTSITMDIYVHPNMQQKRSAIDKFLK